MNYRAALLCLLAGVLLGEVQAQTNTALEAASLGREQTAAYDEIIARHARDPIEVTSEVRSEDHLVKSKRISTATSLILGASVRSEAKQTELATGTAKEAVAETGFVANANYRARLDKPEGHWRIDLFQQLGEHRDKSSALDTLYNLNKTDRHLADILLQPFGFPKHLRYEELSKDSNLKIQNLSLTTDTDGRAVLHYAFPSRKTIVRTRRTPDGKESKKSTEQVVKTSCTVHFDRQRQWIPIRAVQVESFDDGKEFTETAEREFTLSDEVFKSHLKYTLTRKIGGKLQTHEDRVLDWTVRKRPIDENEISLSSFGLPEPYGVEYPQAKLWKRLLAVVLVTAFLGSLALYVRSYRKRARGRAAGINGSLAAPG